MIDPEKATEGLFTYRRPRLYRVACEDCNSRKNLGFDYTDDVIKKTVSPHILRNEVHNKFLIFINDYVVNLINAVKKVRIHRVYSVDKDYEHIN